MGFHGAAHAMRITAAEDSGAAGLNNFAYTTPNNSVQTVAASDAAFTMDGVTVTRESNEVTDLIKGVKLTVKSTTSAAEKISASYDTTKAHTTTSTSPRTRPQSRSPTPTPRRRRP